MLGSRRFRRVLAADGFCLVQSSSLSQECKTSRGNSKDYTRGVGECTRFLQQRPSEFPLTPILLQTLPTPLPPPPIADSLPRRGTPSRRRAYPSTRTSRCPTPTARHPAPRRRRRPRERRAARRSGTGSLQRLRRAVPQDRPSRSGAYSMIQAPASAEDACPSTVRGSRLRWESYGLKVGGRWE